MPTTTEESPRVLAVLGPSMLELAAERSTGALCDLPRALRALGNDGVVAEDGPRPLVGLEPSPPGASIVVLTGRATRVP